jgi:hypothetical protein
VAPTLYRDAKHFKESEVKDGLSPPLQMYQARFAKAGASFLNVSMGIWLACQDWAYTLCGQHTH